MLKVEVHPWFGRELFHNGEGFVNETFHFGRWLLVGFWRRRVGHDICGPMLRGANKKSTNETVPDYDEREVPRGT